MTATLGIALALAFAAPQLPTVERSVIHPEPFHALLTLQWAET